MDKEAFEDLIDEIFYGMAEAMKEYRRPKETYKRYEARV